MSMRLLELESKQLMELTKVRHQSKTIMPGESTMMSPKSRILQQRNQTVMLGEASQPLVLPQIITSPKTSVGNDLPNLIEDYIK